MLDKNLYFHVARLAWQNAYPDCTKNETIWPANIWCSTSVLDCWFYPHMMSLLRDLVEVEETCVMCYCSRFDTA